MIAILRLVKFGSCLWLLILSLPAAAQSARLEPKRILTLEEALALAENYNPRLRAAAAGIEGSAAGIVTAKAYANPTFTFGSLGYQRGVFDPGISGMLNGFNYSQPVELPAVRRTRIEAAELGRRSSSHALDETRLLVRGAVKQAFYSVLRRKREVDLAQGTQQLLEDLRRRIQVQVNVGEAARLELTRADAEVAAARFQTRSAELRLSAALSDLSAAVGAPMDDFDPQAQLDPPALLPPLQDLRSAVMARHPSIALAETEKGRAAANFENERAQRLPRPSLWADMFQQPDVGQFRWGVTVDLPIWNRRQGNIAQAAAARKQAGAIADQRRIEINAALERAYNLYQVANQQVDLFEAGTLRQAEAALSAAEAAFRFGERGIIEVLDAQRVLRSARLDFLNAQYDRQEALVELEQLGVVTTGGGKP